MLDTETILIPIECGDGVFRQVICSAKDDPYQLSAQFCQANQIDE